MTADAEVRERDLQCLVAGRKPPAKRSPLGLLEGEQTRLRRLTSRMIAPGFCFLSDSVWQFVTAAAAGVAG